MQHCGIFEIFFLALVAVSCTQPCAVTEQGRRDPRRPLASGCRGTGCTRVVLGSYFSNTLRPPRMKALQTLPVIYYSALPPWEWWSFSYCVTWISLQFKHIIVSLIPRRGEEQFVSFLLMETFVLHEDFYDISSLAFFLSTNQLRSFSESSQPIQTSTVLQCMWLRTTENKKTSFLQLWLQLSKPCS